MGMFKKAEKTQRKARVAFDGPTGSGKTYSALILATELAKHEGGRVAVIDTENSSASLYSDLFDFDVCELVEFSPENYHAAIAAAEEAGYKVIVIDSFSHAWEGSGGILDTNTKIAKQKYHGNTFSAWGDTTPMQRELIDAITGCKAHIIVTMRSKMDYAMEENMVDGRKKTTVTKIGLAPIQRQGVEYEFDVIVDMDVAHTALLSKSRCHVIADKTVNKPNARFWVPFIEWLTNGAPAPERTRQSTTVTPPPPTGANGNSNGSGKPSNKMWQNWRALAESAEALGLTVESIDPNITSAELAEAGKALRARIAEVEAKIG
jgi:energy-coupling factor transporter ATP-binding protein EcfA2